MRTVSGGERVKDRLSSAGFDRTKRDVRGVVPVVGENVLAAVRAVGKTACAAVEMVACPPCQGRRLPIAATKQPERHSRPTIEADKVRPPRYASPKTPAVVRFAALFFAGNCDGGRPCGSFVLFRCSDRLCHASFSPDDTAPLIARRVSLSLMVKSLSI